MIKSLTNLITAIIIALWLGAIAIFSIQNITEISLKFLLFESIKLPVGVLLSFCVGGGIILGSLLPLLWKSSKRPTRRRSTRNSQKFDEFDFDFDQ